MMQQFDGVGPDLKDMEHVKKGKSKYEEFELLYRSTTDEEREKLQKFMDTMQTLPEELFLVLRSNFLLRSVNRDLGAPINRFNVMARAAARGAAVARAMVLSETSIFQKFALFREELKFEFWLQLNAIKTWAIMLMYEFATYFGFSNSLRKIGFKFFFGTDTK